MHPVRHCGFVGDVTALQLIPFEFRHKQLDQDYVAAGDCRTDSTTDALATPLANLTGPHFYRHGLSAVGLSAFNRPVAPRSYSFLIWGTCAWDTCSPAAKSLLVSSAWGESSQGQFRACEPQRNTTNDVQIFHIQCVLPCRFSCCAKCSQA